MIVTRRSNGCLLFSGAEGLIEIDPVDRRVRGPGASNLAGASFDQITTVAVEGPPDSFLSISLQLRPGRAILLGHAPTPSLANQIASVAAATIGCGFTRPEPSGSYEDDAEAPERFVDLIQIFQDEGGERGAAPLKAKTSSTLEVEIWDILDAVEQTQPRAPEPITDLIPVLTAPGGDPLLEEFDRACAALLRIHQR